MFFTSACRQTSRPHHSPTRNTLCCFGSWKPIDAVTLDGQDGPVKLKVFDSMFVPLAKWSMLLTGN